MTGNSFGNPPLPWRWTLGLSDGSLKQNQVDDQSSEFPRFDERLAGRKHRYGYFGSHHAQNGKELVGFNVVTKRDYKTGKIENQDLGGNKQPGEPVFVPRNAASDEDDGWVLSVWYDPAVNSSELAILDARNFGGAPVARIKAPHRVPFGFHGNWVPA